MRLPKSSVGSLPDAHFCVRGICIITNNAVPIKYQTKNTTGKYSPHRDVFQLYTLANTAVARRFFESSRHISRPCNLQPHQQRCANKMSKQESFAKFQPTPAIICEDILMRCAVNSIFDCAGALSALRAIKQLKFASRSQNRRQIRKRRLKKGVFCIFSLMFFNPDNNFFKHYCEFFSCKFACRVVHFFSLSFNKSDFCHCDDSISAPCRQCVEVFV